VDVPLPHLDRLFDYQVPEQLDADAQPGTRIRVRFSGQLVDAWLIERADDTGHVGKLAWVEKVVSPERVLAPEVYELAREIADRYAGSLIDVLRLAIPPRHAAAEKRGPSERGPSEHAPSEREPLAGAPIPRASPAAVSCDGSGTSISCLPR